MKRNSVHYVNVRRFGIANPHRLNRSVCYRGGIRL